MSESNLVESTTLEDRYLTASHSAVTGQIYTDPYGESITQIVGAMWVPQLGTYDGGVRLFHQPHGRSICSGLIFGLVHGAGHNAPSPGISPSDEVLNSALTSTPQAHAVRWIRDITGLSLERIARLLGVSRQTLDSWRRDGQIADANRQRLLSVQDVLERAHRHHPTPAQLAAWLDKPRGAHARTPAQLLEMGDIDRARLLAVSTPSINLVQSPRWVSEPIPESFQDAIEHLPSSADALPLDHEDIPLDQLRRPRGDQGNLGNEPTR